MIERYADPLITEIWSNENKTGLWQQVELALLEARMKAGELSQDQFLMAKRALEANPIDLERWLELEERTRHDLVAFLDERRPHLPSELHPFWHKEITSYDTEEPAFALMLQASAARIDELACGFLGALETLALAHRQTPMMARTHGQLAEVQSFGKRCLDWFADLQLDLEQLTQSRKLLVYSKMSGAAGNNTGISPELEKAALKILGLKPFFGATQIMPREIYEPLASAVCRIAQTCDKIALAIRLGARGPYPIYQEPFRRGQVGSSAMPGKRNPITCEKIQGMAAMARGYQATIMALIATWEERSIDQSSPERVVWPDLFHVTIHALEQLTKIIKGLRVYPRTMLAEIIASNGCYAASSAQALLKVLGEENGTFDAETAYRLVQLAAFNAFEDQQGVFPLCKNLEAADAVLSDDEVFAIPRRHIRDLLLRGELRECEEVPLTADQIASFSEALRLIFADPESVRRWREIFSLRYLLRNEPHIFEKVFGE